MSDEYGVLIGLFRANVGNLEDLGFLRACIKRVEPQEGAELYLT
jgi:hypothetical protein